MILKDRALPIAGEREELDFAKMRVGMQTINDAVISVGDYKKTNPRYGDKQFILDKINRRDYNTLRDISNYFYESSGIYYRLCRYLAFLYRYDWFVTPFMVDEDKVNENKILADFSKVLLYLDHSNIKKLLGDIALEVIKYGVYYGCLIELSDKFIIQQLPPKYCRSRFFQGSIPVVELNMQFFDEQFKNIQHRLKVLNMFPKDVQRGYKLFKEGKLKGDYPSDSKGWWVLDPETTVKFSLNNSEFPPLVGVIPSIIDLDAAQDLDRKKTMQQLLKILVQKLPLDKNGDLIFDMEEAKEVHNNAVAMLSRAVGIDVLTTFADIIKIDTKDSNAATSTDDLEKVERTVFNNAGITRDLFNSDSNLAMTNAILSDEASIRDLLFQFSSLLNRMVERFNKKSYSFYVEILETTQYNYKELSKLYKEQVQLGYNKMLPQVALGHSQSSTIAMAQFENSILHLSEIMMPPLQSSTMNSQTLLDARNAGAQKQSTSDKQAGRPEKDDSQKSDKTIQNRESMK